MIIRPTRPAIIAPTLDALAPGALPWEPFASRRAASGPVNTVAPVLGGATYAGGSPAITPGTWSGAPTLTYSLEVDGQQVASGNEAAVEAYVYTLADEGLDAVLYEIPNGATGSQVASNTVAIDLAARIAALYTAAGLVTPGIFLVRRSALDLSLVGSAVETWINRGTGGNATQATGTSRPTYSATAVNSRPGMTLDSGDILATPTINLSAYTAVALTVICSDSDAASKIIAEFSPNASTSAGGFYLSSNEIAGTMRFLANGGLLTSANSGAETLASPKVVTGTVDVALATDEAEIRVSGANATASRSHNGNGTALGNYKLNIGARSGPTAGMTGAICAVVLAAGTTAIPTSTVAEVEALLAGAWGL